MTLHTLSYFVHAGLGVLALATFWTSGLSRKGSPVHRASGKLYLLAMTGLLLAAVPLTAAMLARNPVAGGFLAYLIVITTTSVWTSWRAVKDKRDWARFTGPVYRVLMAANLASGLAVAWLGLFVATQMQLIFVAFSSIGIVGAVNMWRFSRRPPADPRWPLRQHLGAMLGNGVATHIAFLSIGLPKLLPFLAGSSLLNLAWLAPLVVAFVAGAYLTRKYLPRRAEAHPSGVRVRLSSPAE
ncbi:hypothetical protein [Arenimonas sp. MALMAid1274]|uniref:hypothetical protein n=1 Tax=Arenimonas sp. MALMAid1274 TaxID=3411630 RepID=UPI003BA22839